MRTAAALVGLAALCLFGNQPPTFAALRLPGQTYRARTPEEGTFAAQLFRASWTWQHKPPYTPHPIAFASDGTLKQTHGWTAKWEITGSREVTVTLDGQRAVLHFDRTVSKFRGTDFDGHREIWGEIMDDRTNKG